MRGKDTMDGVAAGTGGPEAPSGRNRGTPRLHDAAAAAPEAHPGHGGPEGNGHGGHGHGGHGHGVPRRPADLTPAFRLAVGLNVAYVVVEALAGFATGSLALLADAAHNLTDVAGLLIAWGAVWLAARPASRTYSYGFGRATVMAAFANATAILVGAGAVMWEAIGRLSHPVPLPGGWILAVALVGIGVNAGSALLFRGHGHDMNARGAYLHLVADAAVSVAVVVAAVLILLTGWTIADPLVAIGVSAVIAWTAWDLFRTAAGALLDRVPRHVDPAALERFLLDLPGVEGVHDLHVWNLSATQVAMTAHLVMPAGHPGNGFLDRLARTLAARFGIDHATIQIETAAPDAACPTLARDAGAAPAHEG